MRKVGLGLLTGCGFKAHGGGRCALGAARLEPVLELGFAARIAALLKFG